MLARRILLAALLLVATAIPALAVTVSPNALYIDQRTRSGTTCTCTLPSASDFG